MPRTTSAVRFALTLAAALLCLRAAASADQVSDVFGALTYREIGPAISGGRTSAVAGSDADPRIYYAGGAAGGVFKSEDGGASWHATFDSEPVAPVGALAVSAHDANDVWAGTGEPFPRNTVEEGAGIWHSRDGGKSWQFAGLADSGAIAAISIDPRNPQIVAVAVLGHIFRDARARGVYVTRDGGRTWKQTLYVGPSSGASDITRLPDRPSTLFAGIWQFRRQPWNFTSAGPLDGLYRSDDDGATWRKLWGHGLPPGLTGRIGVAAGSRGRVYAIIQSQTASAVALRRRRKFVASDASRSTDRCAAVLLQPFDGGSGQPQSRHQRVIDPRPLERRCSHIPCHRQERGLGLSRHLVVEGRPAHHRWQRRRGRDLGGRWGELLAALRSAVCATISRRVRRTASLVPFVRRLAGQQLVVRAFERRQRHRSAQP